MKNIILLFVFIWLGQTVIAQEKKFYETAKLQEATYANLLEYADPAFPESAKSGEDVYSDKAYLNKLEEYAKMHPPCPLMRHTGNDETDKAQWQDAVEQWSKHNTFLPRYIPYHLFNRLLTPSDDLLFYQAGVNVWLDKNIDKINK